LPRANQFEHQQQIKELDGQVDTPGQQPLVKGGCFEVDLNIESGIEANDWHGLIIGTI